MSLLRRLLTFILLPSLLPSGQSLLLSSTRIVTDMNGSIGGSVDLD
jgi:hypothetical protein